MRKASFEAGLLVGLLAGAGLVVLARAVFPAPRNVVIRASNDFLARVMLRHIISAQSQFQATARADEDQDGVGEYGSFAELSGALGVRDGAAFDPPALSAAFRNVAGGCVERNNYRFRICLPGPNGLALPERDRGGFDAGRLSPDLAEKLWCVYAWPVEGEGPTFFTNQEGDILQTSGYAGDNDPPPCAAFKDASGLGAPTVMDLPEDRRIGADRHEWKPEE
jgi:hypothetical protein